MKEIGTVQGVAATPGSAKRQGMNLEGQALHAFAIS